MWAGGGRVHEASCSLTSSFALSPSVWQHTGCGQAYLSVGICASNARDKLSVVAERFRATGSKAARVQSGVSGGHDGTWAALEDELNDLSVEVDSISLPQPLSPFYLKRRVSQWCIIAMRLQSEVCLVIGH